MDRAFEATLIGFVIDKTVGLEKSEDFVDRVLCPIYGTASGEDCEMRIQNGLGKNT